MKRTAGLLMVIVLASITGCKGFGMRHLDTQKVKGAKTALVIDTEFFPSHKDTPSNGFNLKCEGMSDEECEAVITRLKALEEASRPKLLTYLAGLTTAMLAGKGMPNVNLDRRVFFDSKQFPLAYKGDLRTYCAVSRDFRDLQKKGYTHVLYAGFPNRIVYKKDKPPAIFFGIEAFMVDLRPELGDMDSKDSRADRLIWCYNIPPSLMPETTRDSWDTYEIRSGGYYKVTNTITTTTYHRNCLGIALVRRSGTPYTLDELFTGPTPLYLDIYKRAAYYGLSFAGQYLSGKEVPQEKLTVGMGAEDFIQNVKVP